MQGQRSNEIIGKRRSEVVGAEGFELSTYGTQNRRATRLRYAPTYFVRVP